MNDTVKDLMKSLKEQEEKRKREEFQAQRDYWSERMDFLNYETATKQLREREDRVLAEADAIRERRSRDLSEMIKKWSKK